MALALWGSFVAAMYSMLGNKVKTETFSGVLESILFTESFAHIAHYCVGKVSVISPHVGWQKGIPLRENGM